MIRPAVRHAGLMLGGAIATKPKNALVRFLYGHSMDARDYARFRSTLRMLRNAFDIVPFADAVALLKDPCLSAGRYVTLSFDDGYKDNYDLIAPLLTDFGASACFFVATGFIECSEAYRRHFLARVVRQSSTRHPMTWAMIRDLANAGFEIGAHTVDHPNLAQIDPIDAQQQIDASAREIELRLERACRWFAWPFGTAADFPSDLLPGALERFDGVFSAIRSRKQFSYEGRVINRDHIEPSWPPLHVRYFAFRHVSRQA